MLAAHRAHSFRKAGVETCKSGFEIQTFGAVQGIKSGDRGHDAAVDAASRVEPYFDADAASSRIADGPRALGRRDDVAGVVLEGGKGRAVVLELPARRKELARER